MFLKKVGKRYSVESKHIDFVNDYALYKLKSSVMPQPNPMSTVTFEINPVEYYTLGSPVFHHDPEEWVDRAIKEVWHSVKMLAPKATCIKGIHRTLVTLTIDKIKTAEQAKAICKRTEQLLKDRHFKIIKTSLG